MFPWDFDRHLDSQYRKCKVCQQYLTIDEMLQDHMELEHPMATVEWDETEEQVTRDSATLDTSRQDRQVKCKYCNRYFGNIAECNMHVNRRHKKVKCPECEKHFVKQADCDNHFRDVHKFVCSIAGCSVFKYNEIELHEHMRYDHRSKMVFRCNKCVKVFSTRSELHQHHEVDHGRVKLADVQGEKYPCLRCHREFLTESIFVSHSRDHKENVYACNECLWHFNTIAGLIKHCQDTHDDRHFACTTCGEVFGSNPNLCRHTTSYHIKLCHVCRRTFVSDDKLIDHMREVHPGATVRTREEMIEDEQAQEHAAHQLFKEFQRRERRKKKKKKKKHRDDHYYDYDDDEDDEETYHPSQDYNDDSQVDLEFRPTRRELREADEEGDS